jgi:hypothetical protein
MDMDPFSASMAAQDMAGVNFAQYASVSPASLTVQPAQTVQSSHQPSHHVSNPFSLRPSEHVQNISNISGSSQSHLIRGTATNPMGTVMPAGMHSPFDAAQMHHVPHPHAHSRHHSKFFSHT